MAQEAGIAHEGWRRRGRSAAAALWRARRAWWRRAWRRNPAGPLRRRALRKCGVRVLPAAGWCRRARPLEPEPGLARPTASAGGHRRHLPRAVCRTGRTFARLDLATEAQAVEGSSFCDDPLQPGGQRAQAGRHRAELAPRGRPADGAGACAGRRHGRPRGITARANGSRPLGSAAAIVRRRADQRRAGAGAMPTPSRRACCRPGRTLHARVVPPRPTRKIHGPA